MSALIVAVATLLARADVNDFRAEIAAAIEAETGRKVVFGGDIVLAVGRTTTLTIKDVRLANKQGGRHGEMLRIAEATAEVATWPLWRGDLEIGRLSLRGADVRVEIDRRGRTNFDFAPAKPVNPAHARAGQFVLDRLGEVDIRDAKVTIDDARDGKRRQLSLRRLRLRTAETAALMRVAASGQYQTDGQAVAFNLNGRTGRFPALIAQDAPFPIDLTGAIGEFTVAAAGTVAEPFAGAGLALHLDISGDDILPLAPIFGADLPRLGPARLKASLSGAPAKFRLADISLALDDSLIIGNLAVDLSGRRPHLQGQLAADHLDLRPWWGVGGTALTEEARVFNNDRIAFEGLLSFDGALSIAAQTVDFPALQVRDVELSFALERGQLAVPSAKARLDGNTVTGDLAVNALADPPTVQLNLAAPEFDVGRLLARLYDEPFVHGSGGIDLAIDGRGRSLAQIIGSSSGHARILMDAGEVKTGSLGLLVGGVSELVSGLGSGTGDWTALNCVAGDFDLRSGVATSRIALLDTEVLRLVGDGEVDLAHDTIEFEVAPSPKSPTLNFAMPVDLTGALADPSITPDEFSLLRRIGGLVGAVLFPPAALLSLGSLGSHDNPCLQAVQSAEVPVSTETFDWNVQPEADRPPEAGVESADRLIDAVKRLLPLRGNET